MKLINGERLTDGKGVFNEVIHVDFDRKGGGYIKLEDLLNVLDTQPVAYDVDKVIEQLKEEGCIMDNAAGNRAIEIIRAGGIKHEKNNADRTV